MFLSGAAYVTNYSHNRLHDAIISKQEPEYYLNNSVPQRASQGPLVTEVQDLVAEATAKLRAEAERLRAEIKQREKALQDEVAPIRAQLRELDEAIARIEGTPGRALVQESKRAPRGHNRKLILEFLGKNPGAKPTEVAEATSISKPTVYATLAKLEHDGLLAKSDQADGIRYAPQAEK